MVILLQNFALRDLNVTGTRYNLKPMTDIDFFFFNAVGSNKGRQFRLLKIP